MIRMLQRSLVVWLVALGLVAWVAPAGRAQEGATFQDFVRTLEIAPGLPVSLVHLNAVTLPVVFQPPTIDAIRARTRVRTLFFIQGTANSDTTIDTSGFQLEQDGQSSAGETLNIRNFEDGDIDAEVRVDGIVEFPTKADVSKRFSVKHGGQTAVFSLTEAQATAAMAAPAP